MANISKLDEIASAEREKLKLLNIYKDTDDSTKYSDKHPNALSDGDEKGRGTGKFLDTENGGTIIDNEGLPNVSKSGRKGNLSLNIYNKDNPYKKPDIT
jgi:hypothetical protein